MRTRIAAPVLVGALALAALTVPGTASAATTAKPVVTSATMTSFAPGLSGVSKPVIRISVKDAAGAGSIRAVWVPDSLASAFKAADVAKYGVALPTVARTATTLTVGGTLPFDAAKGKDRLHNSWAGHWTIEVLVTGKDGRTTFAPKAGGFTIKRADMLSAKPGAPTVRKGAALTVKGQLNRADWDKGVWAGNGGQSVQIQFRKAGTHTWVTKAVARTAANGSVSASVRDYASGSWRLVYNGNAVSGAAVSGATTVAVK